MRAVGCAGRGEPRGRAWRGALVTALVILLAQGSYLPDAHAHRARRSGPAATPSNDGEHRWSTDGCTGVPEEGLHTALVPMPSGLLTVPTPITAAFDFHHACVHHDGCYRGKWSDRATCDARFLSDMRASCAELETTATPARAACEDRARIYFAGVRVFGADAYRRSSHRARAG